MRQRKLIRRLTSAVVAGAMALSLCAPALAAAPSAAEAVAGLALHQTYVQADDYGITVAYMGSTAVEVTKENAGNVLGSLDGAHPSVSVERVNGVYQLKVTEQGINTWSIAALEINAENAGLPVDVTVTLSKEYYISGLLKITGAHDVTMTGDIGGAMSVGGAEIACDGDVHLSNVSGGVVWNGLIVNGAQDVTVESGGNSTTLAGASNRGIELNCSGEVKIVNHGSGCVVSGYTLKVCADQEQKAAKVTVEGNSSTTATLLRSPAARTSPATAM